MIPVRVRNISELGALVDGSSLPSDGTQVELRRGSLRTVGKIAWTAGNQCGLRFAIPIAVASWVKKIVSPHQEHVDQMIEVARGNATLAKPLAHETKCPDTLPQLNLDLLQVCERLLGVSALVSEHPEKLLELDAIAQRLAKFTEPMQSHALSSR